MKKHLLPALLALLLLAVAMGGCSLFPEEEEELPPPLVEVKVTNYQTKSPERRTIERTVEGTGKVEAENISLAMFTIRGGTISNIHAFNGDLVKEGDVLCELDNRELDETLKVAEMEYEISSLEYADAEMNYSEGKLSEVAWKRAELAYYRATTSIESLRERYGATQLISPANGTVIFAEPIQVGSEVGTYQTLYKIADKDKLLIRYNSSNYTQLHLFDEVELTYNVSGVEVLKFTGKVVQTPDELPESHTDADRYSVVIKPDIDITETVPMGAVISVYRLLERSENAIVISKSAVKTTGTRTYVYVLVDGYRQERDVVVGLDGGYDVEIIRGLEEDDLIIY